MLGEESTVTAGTVPRRTDGLPSQAAGRAGHGPDSRLVDHSLDPGRFPFALPVGWFLVAEPGDVAVGSAVRLERFATELVLARRADGLLLTGADGRRWPVVERNGGVFAWHHPHGAAPHWEVPDLPPFDRPAGPGTIEAETRLEIGTCLQEITENGYDRAHLPHVHGTTAAHDVTFTEEGDHRARLQTVLRYDTARGPVTQAIDNRSWGPGLGLVHFAGALDTWFLATAVPIDHARSEVRFRYRFRAVDGGPADPRAARRHQAEIERQYHQDQEIWEHKAYLTRPALTDGEALILRFRRWYQRFYADPPAEGERRVWAPPAPHRSVAGGRPGR